MNTPRLAPDHPMVKVVASQLLEAIAKDGCVCAPNEGGLQPHAMAVLAEIVSAAHLSGIELRPSRVEYDKLAGQYALALLEIERLNAIIHHPESDEFFKGVAIEAEFQRQKHAAEDAKKGPADWYWLAGYLLGKALYSLMHSDMPKAKHHIVTTAALCYNWHRSVTDGQG